VTVEECFDIGNGPTGHFLVDSADEAPLDFLVKAFFEYP